MFIKKNQFYIIIAVIVFLMAVYMIYSIRKDNRLNNNEENVIKLVKDFGSTLKNVPLCF